jgi:hypothetical protein
MVTLPNDGTASAFLPSYQELFGDLSVRNGDDSGSVYSPAAYLADLLELVDDSFEVSPLRERRPDLEGIALNGDNSYTVLPYLDIVNEVLERNLGKDAETTLRDGRVPLTLPFSLSNERRKEYLRRFGITAEELYRQFAVRVDGDVVAREFLGLSEEDVRVTVDRQQITLPVDTDEFRHATTLSAVEVRELLYQNLSPAQRSAASAFFIHYGGGCVTLDEDEQRLLPPAGEDGIAEGWFDRVGRFVRLARRTGMSLSDLDLVLRDCCGNELNLPALRILAAIMWLQKGLDLPIDVVCALVAPMNTIGLGDEDRPGNLFGRVFGAPPAYTGDILAELNRPYRQWLTRVLGLTEADIVATVTRFRARKLGPFERADADADLSLLHRISVLQSTLDVSAEELFGVLDALESDPSMLSFPVPIDTKPTHRDAFQMLDAREPGSSLWLMQALVIVVRWLRAHSLGSDELVRVLGGAAATPGEQDAEEQREFVAQVRQQFETVALSPETLVSRRFSSRAAEVIHRELASHAGTVVSRRDPRLLRLDRAAAESVAYQGIVRLAEITENDFLGFGLDERFTAKIFANLVLTGHLDPTGVATAEPDDLPLATDFSDYRDAVFALIAELCQTEQASLYPSDLDGFEELADEELAELYDNLVFNAYLDTEGTVLDPGFFTEPDNVETFAVNADLSTVEPAVFELFKNRAAEFGTLPLALDPEIFAGLELTEQRQADLLTSLRFNGYLTTDGNYADCCGLTKLDPADFGLALEFYPLRGKVLDAMREQIETARAEHNTFAPEDFQDIADHAVARRVVELLSVDYLTDGHVPEELRPRLSDPDTDMWLSDELTASETATVFHQVASILLEQQAYQLDFTALTQLDFSLDDAAELVALLITDGYLTEELTIPANRLDFFRNVHNALTFSPFGFEDFGKDVFFLLHGVATELTAGVAEIVDALSELAATQESTLVTALRDGFGVTTATAAAMCDAITGGAPDALDVLVAPALATEGDSTDVHFRVAYRRIKRFATLTAKLALDEAEVAVAFQDQDLVGKFPEPLALPPGVDRIDALLEDADGKVYVFGEPGYWVYSAVSYTLEDPNPKQLSTLSSRLAELSRVDAAVTDAAGTRWIIGRDKEGASRAFTKERDDHHWLRRDQLWGRIKNNFADPAKIDTAFTDDEGRTYLFCGDQYIRYSSADYSYVDEGYPRTLGEWREDEGPHVRLAASYEFALDASFQGTDGKVRLFKEDRFLTIGGTEQPIAEIWGRVRNGFAEADHIDAAYVDGSTLVLFLGQQVIRYSDGIENLGVRVDDGTPVRIETQLGDVPPEFENAIDAALIDGDGIVHLFKDGKTVPLTATQRVVEPTATRWGVLGNVLPSGTVDAAFVGLDGKTYLFSGERYIRYSGADYAVVDVGYPRQILGDWAGLATVDAAFVLDGTTYLFGAVGETPSYVRYSTRNYATPDAGYPKPLSDNWWNLPAELAPEFGTVDAVFTGRDRLTYLFSGQRFVVFDSKHRWWSEPKTLRAQWDSIPFNQVDSAFVGSDGKTYVFSGDQYVRYSTADYTRVDDRYPAPIGTFWGNVVNNIARTGKVDATLTLDSPEPRTYLFSGNQFVRYTGHDYGRVDNGYPKNLASLKDEPRLGNLDVVLDHVDAAFADQRNVYLFAGQQCHIVSDATYRAYDLGQPGVGCVFIEDGSVLVERADGWRRYSALEGKSVNETGVRPRTLRTVPPDFRTGLDSILQGTDGNTYLFKETSCLNTALGHSYPLAEEWGRQRNNIYEDNRVDAAFVGRDGKTYVFSGDQFVVYGGTTYLDAEIEGEPRSIPEHWAGLENVALAYLYNGQTYLFERPGDDGIMRYLVYSGTDYTTPDDGYPSTTDSAFWSIPDDDLPEEFTAPDAVLREGTATLLLIGEHCLQFDDTTGVWTRPRPVNRIWPGLGKAELTAAFTGLDGATYFFFPDEFARYHERILAPRQQIRDHWSQVRDEFTGKDGTGRVDAAVVVGDRTFLFSAKHYVRYSGRDYRYVDAGYPRPIVANLRKETEFAQLPESFEEVLADRIDAGTPALIDGAVAGGRNVYLFTGSTCHVVSLAPRATYDLSIVGRVRNNLADQEKVDAALVVDGYTYLFSGDQYVRYSGADYTFVDDGYPRTLELSPPVELGFATLPEAFLDGIDAAFRGADHGIYLFAGKQFVRDGSVVARPVTEVWGQVRNLFTTGQNSIDAAFVAPTGELYAFRAGQFIRYRQGELELAEEGYPRTIKDDWGNLPAGFEEGVDAAFVFEGRTYLVCGNEYVRYSGNTYDTIDRTYPQTFGERWANTADYRLTDLYTITRFVDLVRAHPPGVAEFLVSGNEDPYGYLSGIFGWDAEELRWVKRHGGFLPSGGAPEYRFELEFLLKAAEMFEVAGKVGAGPSRVFADIWSKIYEDKALDDANTILYGLLESSHDVNEWPTVAGEIHDELNLRRRDALVAAVTSKTLRTSRDLFERLLIDVDMGSAGRTSKIREAIAATQLYVHRYLLNLEAVTPRENGAEEDTRRRLKRWWAWMRAYRTWEANRKVFLYPENYLRPELRDGKTPAFQQLEDDLLRGEITTETVQRAYKKYLDEYTEVSRLAIAGGYVFPRQGADKLTRSLVLFGTTRTDPRRYYYRNAEIRGLTKLSTTWEPWLKVGVQIDADEVAPIHAFGRVFVFWAIPDSSSPPGSSTTITTTKDGDSQHVSGGEPTNRFKICFSFLDLNGEWVPVQSRTVDSGVAGPVSGLKVSVSLGESSPSTDVTGEKHESIFVNCSGVIAAPRIGLVRWSTVLALPPELYLIQLSSGAVPVIPTPDDSGLRAEIFDPEPSNRIGEARVVQFNSTSGDTSWFSIDHRGGSFLFRPDAALIDEKITPRSLRSDGRLPNWKRIDAAVELPDGSRLFFNNTTRRFRFWGTDDDEIGRPQAMQPRWRVSAMNAAYLDNGALYLISGNTIARYTLDSSLAPEEHMVPQLPDEGYPRPLGHQVNAVFRRGGQLYVFGDKEYTRVDAGTELDAASLAWRPIRGNWGGLPAAFESTFDTVLDGANDLYVFLNNEYVGYDKNAAVRKPYDRSALRYEIVRLTTGTAHKLNVKLLEGGVAALLDPLTQEYDEVPAFSTEYSNETTIRVREEKVEEAQLPTSTHLDFGSANGIYYWEIFFHAPLLIAQALNGAQRFEDARQWYEYVFDPTEPANYWRFLPFLAVDPWALAESCRRDLFMLAGCDPGDTDELTRVGLDAAALRDRLDPLLSTVDRIAPAFQRRRPVDDQLIADFATTSASTAHVDIEQRMRQLSGMLTDESRSALNRLREKTAIVTELRRQYTLLGDPDRLIRAYQDDPFDPHAIAALRPVAYRRAVVMAYIDNLLDWGDMLFRQYTPESVDEARMLYVFAYDLLGTQPETLGTRLVPAARTYSGFEAVELDPRTVLTGDGALLEGSGEVHGSVANRYFSIPGNTVFADYWARVEDRLRKIRLSQNILGISQPLPLFAPPIDPMALVEGAAAGADLAGLSQDAAGAVPHYRFGFMYRKAQDLVDKLKSLGGDLLNALERGDGEALGLLQNRQEGAILELTRAIKEAQVLAAEEDFEELKASKEGATKRLAYYQKLVNDGLSALENSQLDTMAVASAAHLYSAANRIGAAFAYGMPQALLGPFIMGTEMGGKQAGKVFDKTSEIWESLGEGLSVVGELLGVRAGHERSMAEWRNQKETAESDLAQIGHQLAGAEQQLAIAARERDILAQEIAHNQAEATFLTGKFTNSQLYQWMSGRLAETYFQVYNLAYEMAKAAEQAFRFEHGEASFIRPSYWDNRRNGLLAAEGLGLDLERMGTAYLDKDSRDLEITKPVSLLELDPVALLRLKNGGSCEFGLTEALFDYDFPGHFRRQIRTVTVTFTDADGSPLGRNATLTQLGHKTVLSADPKAVKHLLDPKGLAPATVRADWRPGQRIALSPVDEGMPNNGLFELRFDDDRYLPFEGTGAVSTWRLELSGRRPADLHNVVITVRYTAEAGDQVFTNAVKGMLKTYPAARFFDVATEFSQEWQDFLAGDEQQLTLPIAPELFPNMSGTQITGIYPKYELTNGTGARFTLDGDQKLPLTDGKLLATPGLRLHGDGESSWTLVLDGDKEALTNLGLVLTYKAGV